MLEDYTGSDHQYIKFNAYDELKQENIKSTSTRIWNVAKLDPQKLIKSMEIGLLELDLTTTYKNGNAETVVNKHIKLLKKHTVLVCQEKISGETKTKFTGGQVK